MLAVGDDELDDEWIGVKLERLKGGDEHVCVVTCGVGINCPSYNSNIDDGGDGEDGGSDGDSDEGH